MMQVRIILLAAYRELAGRAELELRLPAGATAADAVARLRGESDRAARLPERPVVAVNQEWATLDTKLRDGDEIALLPPVAGG